MYIYEKQLVSDQNTFELAAQRHLLTEKLVTAANISHTQKKHVI